MGRRDGYSPEQISRAIYLLNTEAKNPTRSLYDNNKAVYSLIRYGVSVKTEAGKATDTYIHTYKFGEAVDGDVVLDLVYEARDVPQELGSLQDKGLE